MRPAKKPLPQGPICPLAKRKMTDDHLIENREEAKSNTCRVTQRKRETVSEAQADSKEEIGSGPVGKRCWWTAAAAVAASLERFLEASETKSSGPRMAPLMA